MTTTAIKPELLMEHEVSALYQISVTVLRRWRAERRGPKYFKIGHSVRYSRADLATWLASRPTGGESLQEPCK
jgi:predicted DNA-binding transcriptional regulator AlpA